MEFQLHFEIYFPTSLTWIALKIHLKEYAVKVGHIIKMKLLVQMSIENTVFLISKQKIHTFRLMCL